MKKTKLIIPIILCLAFIVFCTRISYTEISENSIVSGIAIDFEGDEWTVTCEINMPSSSNDFASSALYIKGKGYTLYNALEDAALKSPAVLYTDTVQLYLLSAAAGENNCVYQYFRDGNVNLRAIAVRTEGKAADVFGSEDEEDKSTKSIAITDKIKNYCDSEKIPFPDITDYLKGGHGVIVSKEKTVDGRTNEFK